MKVSAFNGRAKRFSKSSTALVVASFFNFQKRSARSSHTKLIWACEANEFMRTACADPCLAANEICAAICGDARKISDYKASLFHTHSAPIKQKIGTRVASSHFSTLMIWITSMKPCCRWCSIRDGSKANDGWAVKVSICSCAAPQTRQPAFFVIRVLFCLCSRGDDKNRAARIYHPHTFPRSNFSMQASARKKKRVSVHKLLYSGSEMWGKRGKEKLIKMLRYEGIKM